MISRPIDLTKQAISPGKLVSIASISGLLIYQTNISIRLHEMSPMDTITPEMDFRLTRLPVGSIVLCLEYEIYSDMKFFAKILYGEKTFEVFGKVGDFEVVEAVCT